jgi:hypothetical protein
MFQDQTTVIGFFLRVNTCSYSTITANVKPSPRHMLLDIKLNKLSFENFLISKIMMKMSRRMRM